MSSDLILVVLPALVLTGITDIFALYAAYLSLSVRRGLAVPVYRSRALWMAFLGISAAIVFTYEGFTNISPTSPLTSIEFREILFAIPLGIILILIDRTANTLIKMDFLRRDLLLWKKLHFVYGTAVVLFYVLYYSRYVYFVPDAEVIALVLYFSALIYGALAIARGTTVTRDMTFRSHAIWFGILLAAFITGSVLYFAPVPLDISFVCFTVASYCFYKMAGSLVPAGKLSASPLQ